MSEQDEDLRAELARLRSENETLRAKETRGLRLQVSTKHGVSLYGIRRFPVTFYADEWEKILGMGATAGAIGVSATLVLAGTVCAGCGLWMALRAER